MGFIQRAFTPPGTGGREAAAIQAQTDAANAMAQMQKMQAAKPTPDVPTIAAAPPAPPGFQAQLQAGAKQKSAQSAKSLLGAAATSGQMAGAQATGGQRKTTLGS